MNQFIKKIQKIRGSYITDSGVSVVFYETREMATLQSRDIEKVSATQRRGNVGTGEASRDMKIIENQKAPNNWDSLKWTRGGLHPFHQVLTLICYFIHHGPGSTHLLYRKMTETSKQKEPLLKEALFVAPDNVRNVRTISVYSNYTPIHEGVKWICG